MNCISPSAPEDQILLAYLDGKSDSDIAIHLEQCGYCQARVKALSTTQGVLKSKLYRSLCPTSVEVGEYYLHLLHPARMLVVAQHVRECPHCTSEVNQLQDFLNDLAPKQENKLTEQAKTLLARLVPKNKAGTPSPVLRGAGGNAPMMFEVDDIVVILDTKMAADGKISILGQIAADEPNDWTGAVVELRQAQQLEVSTTIDDLGTFHCESILPGLKDLRIIPSQAPVIIVLSTFEVSAHP